MQRQMQVSSKAQTKEAIKDTRRLSADEKPTQVENQETSSSATSTITSHVSSPKEQQNSKESIAINSPPSQSETKVEDISCDEGKEETTLPDGSTENEDKAVSMKLRSRRL